MVSELGRILSILGAISLLTVVGCKRDAKRSSRAASQQETARQPVPQQKAVETQVRTEQARALLEEWLRAQNGGEFATYEALYAQRFTGIKRVGAQTYRFDRDGWMQDRKALFARAFSVSIDDVRTTVIGSSAIVGFSQTWTSATFRDVGKKQLVLSREGDAWRIASEEMKESNTGASDRATAAPTPSEFSFVVAAPGPFLILSDRVDPAAVTGRTRYVADDLAVRPLATQALPEGTRALLGRKFVLYGDGGAAPVCEGTIDALEALASLRPHFGTTSAWDGRDGGPVATADERASQLWSHSEYGGRFLAARLTTSSPCEGARWARSAELPKPTFWSSRAPTTEERAAILKVVRGAALHRELQKSFEQAFGKTTPWDDSGALPRFVVFADRTGQTFASLVVSAGVDDACDSPFDPDVFYLLQKRGSGWVIVSAPPEAHARSAWPRFLEPLRAERAFDLEGDGRPEFVGWRDFIRESGGTYRSVLNRSPAYFDCPC